MCRTRSALLRSAVSHDSTVGRTAVGRESQQRMRRTTLDLYLGRPSRSRMASTSTGVVSAGCRG